jgi:hypothetical protein
MKFKFGNTPSFLLPMIIIVIVAGAIVVGIMAGLKVGPFASNTTASVPKVVSASEPKAASTSKPKEVREPVLVYDNTKSSVFDIGEQEFNKLFANNLIVKRECPGCTSPHQTIYYKRITPIPSTFSIYKYLTDTWKSANNVLNTDFKLYSSLDDLNNDKNSWQYCNYDDTGVGSFRDCAPKDQKGNQWNGPGYGGRGQKVKFYI